jgi:polar amino acid transport system substrate-binding protein
MKKLLFSLSLLIILGLLISACASAGGDDQLATIKSRGTLIVSSDPAYPPQSELVENAVRNPDTKCASDQKTGEELQGFDIDVAKEVAKRLGVEVCFVTPDWTLITAGKWADRWDLSIGSMTVTPDRMQNLYFTQPYYTTPAAFFVSVDNTSLTQPADLSGKKVGACTGCTYDKYLLGTLEIPGETIEFLVKDVQFTGYETDLFALEDLALGDGTRLDGVLTAEPTGQLAVTNGLAIKQLGDPVFFEYLAGAIDKSSTKDPVAFVKEVTKFIQQMHADGTLKTLSEKWYGTDLAAAAATFDFDALNQFP